GRANDRGDQVLADLEGDARDGGLASVRDRDIAHVEDDVAHDGRRLAVQTGRWRRLGLDADAPRGGLGCGLCHGEIFERLRASSARAPRLDIRMNTRSTNAAPHARVNPFGSACSDSVKM